MSRAAPLVVFSDDWGRHPSSSQHLVARLPGERQVLWVNTIGTRAPRLDLATARRVVEKLGQWTRPRSLPGADGHEGHDGHDGHEGHGGLDRRHADDGHGGDAAPASRSARGAPRAPVSSAAPRVLAPRMWPSFASAPARALNRRLLAAALAPELARLPDDPVVLTTIPLVADLVGTLRARRWVYYCVDDFGAWPGYDGPTLARMERELVPRADAVVCASDALAARMRALGARPGVISHGVDLAAWRTAADVPRPAEFDGLTGPIVLFWGVVDRRMDVDWIAALSARMTTGTVVLVGPAEDPDPALRRLPRVVLRPPVPPRRLAALAAHARVLVMPYVDAPVTRAMQPLKLKEYLATGRPAVVRALPATRPWASACDVREDASSFADAVLARLDGTLPPAQALERERLAAESWDDKAVQLARWLDGHATATAPIAADVPCGA